MNFDIIIKIYLQIRYLNCFSCVRTGLDDQVLMLTAVIFAIILSNSENSEVTIIIQRTILFPGLLVDRSSIFQNVNEGLSLEPLPLLKKLLLRLPERYHFVTLKS